MRRSRAVTATVAAVLAPVVLAGVLAPGARPASAADPRVEVRARTGPPLPGAPRTEVAGIRWDGRVAVAGGLVDGLVPTRDLFLYDPERETWSSGPSLPGARDHAALVALGSHLYLVGGYALGLRGPSAEVWRLSSPTGTWERRADLGTPRGALTAVAAGGRLLAIGGANDSGALASTEIYEPATDRWRPGPSMAVPREHVGATVAGGRVYVVGGRNPQNLDGVEILDAAAGGFAAAWRAGPPLNDDRGGNAATTVASRPCTAGGEEAAGTIGSVECLVGDRWRRVATLAVPRHGLAVVGIGRDLHVVSGGPRPGATYSAAHEVLRIRVERSPS